MGYKINKETSTGAIAQYAKVSSYTVSCVDEKQVIQAVFQLYASKEKKDANYTPFEECVNFKFELKKDFNGNILKKIYTEAKQLEEFATAEEV